MPLALEINRHLNVSEFANAYAQHGVARVTNVLAPHSADAVACVLETQMPWQLALCEGGDPLGSSYDGAAINALGQAAMKDRVRLVLERARDGFSYLYLNYPMIEAYIRDKDPGHPIHEVSAFLNNTEFLDLLRAVTARRDIIKAEASATFYRPGDFLTLHDDGATALAHRVCAYTLGFTRAWRPDWGGQLLFHDGEGHITRGFVPAFNCLTLFTVPRSHSVAPVAPYAAAPRLSIAGWGRSDPPPKKTGTGVVSAMSPVAYG